MLNKTTKFNRVSVAALIYAVLGLLCAAIILLATSFTVTAGTVDDAKNLGTEFDTTITDKTPAPYPDNIISMTYLRDSVFVGSTFSKQKFDEFIVTYALDNTVITLSNPRELLMFSAYSNGVEISDFAPTTLNTTLMNHLLQSKFVLANNIDYLGNDTYYLGSTDLSKTAKIGKAGGSEDFTSNGIYDGYFDGSLIVPNYFLPIQNFRGSFDGQNFEIRNLIIMRNAKQNSTGIDAMFASVSAGGTVTSFGLVDTQFKRHNTYSNNVAIVGGNYALNLAAAIVGNNVGTVSYVYAVNTKIETVFDVFGAYNLPAVLIGVASEYYVGFTNGSTSFDSANTNYTATATDTFGKRWYKIGANGENEAVFDNYFTNKYSAYARLSGFKADGRITGESFAIVHTNAVMHEILRPVDFVNMSRFVMENGGKSLWFRLVNDLDFRLVSDLAYISATSLTKTTSVLLFSDPNLVANADGTFDTPFPYDNSTNSGTISNLKINAYLKSSSETVVGLFNQLVNDRNNDYNNPLEFFNLNFINCIATPPVNDTGAAYVGFLAGAIRNGIGVINTLVNANIVAEDNTAIGGNTYYGGLVGSFLSINSNANKPFTNGTFFSRVAFKGTVLGGIRTHSGSYNTAFGGIFGRMEVSTGNIFDTVNVSADITGIYPVASATNVKLQVSVGGLMGHGKLGSTYQGVYISDQSVISNFPDNSTGIITVSTESHEIFVGGLVGRDRGGDATTFDAVKVDADIKLAGEYITPTDNNGAFTTVTTINIKAYYGGIAGASDSTTINDKSPNLNVSQFFGGQFVMPVKDKVNRFVGFELYLGNLFGGVNSTKVHNLINDKNLILDFSRTTQLQVGGLIGTRIANSNPIINCHNSATVHLTMYSNDKDPSGKQVNFNLGGVGAADAQYTDCSNNGTVKISLDVVADGGAHTRVFGVGSHGSFSNCENNGSVIYEAKSGGGNNQSAAGISNGGTVNNSRNTSLGKVKFIVDGVAGGNFYAAGISSGGNVVNSQNLGFVQFDINGAKGGNFYAAGILSTNKVEGSDNLGTIHYNIANATGGNANSSGIVSTGTNMNSDSDYGVTNCVNGTKGMTSSSHTFTILNSDNTTTTGMNITVSGIAFGSKRANINSCVNYSPINGVATSGTQYYAGISRQSGAVSQSANYGDITVGGYDSTNPVYVAGITNELYKPDSNNIIYGTIAMSNNTNYGDISVDSFKNNLFVGGVFNFTEINPCYSLVNFGNLTATSGTLNNSTTQAHVGGIFSHTRSNHSSVSVSDSMNFGDITLTAVANTHNAHGAWSAGGILGGNDAYGTNSVNASHTISNCINTGNITLNATNTTADTNNYYTYGAGGILGIAYNKGVSTNDNYIVNNCVNSGTITYLDNSNYTNYELGGGGGGIIGNVNSVADYVTVNGALNYGAVKSNINAGGIVGVTNSNNVNVNGAINYGAVGQANSVNSGGIFGRNDKGNITLSDVVNYGTLLATNMGGIIAKNNTGSLSLNKAVYIDSSTTLHKLVGSGTATYTNAYYASDNSISTEQGVTTKTVNGSATDNNWIYADNFMWGKANTYTTTQTMVWSQKAYKSASGYHSTSITDTNSHIFALTNSYGTEKGEYLGNNYTLPSFIDSTHTALAQSKLADLKQISISRDTHYTHSNNATHGLQLIDKGKQGDNQYLPTPLYNDGTKTFTSVIRPSSTYYGNNHGENGFTYDGANTDIMSQYLNQNVYYDWSLAFSKSAKSIWKNGGTTVFNSAQEGMDTLISIATFYLIVYQSDVTIADDTSKNIQQMEAMLDSTIGEDYYTTYTVRVYFFNEQDPTFMPDESVVDAFTYDNKLGTTALDTAAEGVGSSSGEEAYLEYKLEQKADKTPVIVDWDKGTFKGIFEVNGIEAQTVTDSGVFELVRVKDIYGNAVTDTAINLKNFPDIFTLTTNINQIIIPDIQEELSTSSGTITVTIKFTDFNIIDEIKSGSYKLVIKLPKAFLGGGSVDYLERVITFDKEMSGDTYLKYGVDSGNQISYNNKIANGEPNINIFARLAAYYSSNPNLLANSIEGRNYGLKTSDNKNVNFVDIASTDSSSGTKTTNYTPLIFDLDSSYYGTMPALPRRDGGITSFFSGFVTTADPTIFYNTGGNNRLVTNPFATFATTEGKLDIKFSRRNDGTYTITYSFSVLAENGDIGKYTQIYNFNQLPTMAYAADDPNSLAPDGKTISVGRTSSGTVSATYVGLLHKVNDFIGVTGYTLYIADADNKWKPSTDPMFDGLKLPIISVSGGKVMFTFERDTLGGRYSIVPSFAPSHYVPLEAYPDMVSFDGVTPSSGNWLNSFSPTNIDEGVLVSKEASKNSHLRDFEFTNPPTGAKFAFISNNTAFPINESQTIVGDALTLNYGTSRQPDPNTGERFNNFRLQLNYNEDGVEGGDDTEYSTFMTILIKRWDKLPALEADIYNDEFVTIYTRDGTTLKDKLTVYKDDPASDYIEYRIYVAGGDITGLRVYAENTLFYTDYDFVTDGPVMNKTFNLTVNAPKDASGLFVISLKTLVGDRYTRTTNVLLLVGGSGGDSDIKAELTNVNGVEYYTKTYRLTRNTAATYEATAVYPTVGYSHKLSNVSLLSGSGNVVLQTDLLRNRFTLVNNDAATVNVTVDIYLNADYKPPWGVGI